MNFSAGTFDQQEERELEEARVAYEAANPGVDDVPAEGAPAAAPAAPAPAPAPAAPAAAPAAPAAPAPEPAAAPAPTPAAPAAAPGPAPAPAAQPPAANKPAGEVRAALRASRQAEKRSRDEAERFRQENEELRAKLPPPVQAGVAKPDAAVLEDVKTYAAPAAEYMTALERENAELRSKVAGTPAAAPPPEFRPPVFELHVQDAIDDVPLLAAWQTMPDQKLFRAAQAADAILMESPKWAGRPLEARLAEAVRLVNEQMGVSSPAETPEQIAARVIAAAPVAAAPVSIGGLPGGVSPGAMKPNLAAMTDEQILNMPD